MRHGVQSAVEIELFPVELGRSLHADQVVPARENPTHDPAARHIQRDPDLLAKGLQAILQRCASTAVFRRVLAPQPVHSLGQGWGYARAANGFYFPDSREK